MNNTSKTINLTLYLAMSFMSIDMHALIQNITRNTELTRGNILGCEQIKQSYNQGVYLKISHVNSCINCLTKATLKCISK